jgi:hypothetical protein
MSYQWNQVAFKRNSDHAACSGHAESAIEIKALLPARQLRPFVADYVSLSASPDASADSFFSATFNLDFVLEGKWRLGTRQTTASGPFFRGTQSAAMSIEMSQSETFSLTLTPLGWARFCGQDANLFADMVCPANKLFGDRLDTLNLALDAASTFEARAQVADAFFLPLASPNLTEQELMIGHLQAWFDNPEPSTVQHFCLTHATTPAKLGRICRRAFGFTPKFLLRRARFLRMLDILMVRPYGEWRDFLDPLYVDQSHFIRDFHSFMGMAPNRYLMLPHPMQSAYTAERLLLSDFDALKLAA